MTIVYVFLCFCFLNVFHHAEVFSQMYVWLKLTCFTPLSLGTGLRNPEFKHRFEAKLQEEGVIQRFS